MEIVRQIFAVILVFALLAAAVWALRRAQTRSLNAASWFGPRFKAPVTLERVGRLALTPQHTLHLVRIQGREVLVATHPQGCSVIHADSVAVEATI